MAITHHLDKKSDHNSSTKQGSPLGQVEFGLYEYNYDIIGSFYNDIIK